MNANFKPATDIYADPVKVPQTFDHDIYSIDPGVQLRALSRMKDEAIDAAEFWQEATKTMTGTARQGAIQNMHDAWKRHDIAHNALLQLGDD